jgi:hypothetical protein
LLVGLQPSVNGAVAQVVAAGGWGLTGEFPEDDAEPALELLAAGTALTLLRRRPRRRS